MSSEAPREKIVAQNPRESKAQGGVVPSMHGYICATS